MTEPRATYRTGAAGPKAPQGLFVLYGTSEPDEAITAEFEKRYGRKPGHLIRTRGGVLAGPLLEVEVAWAWMRPRAS